MRLRRGVSLIEVMVALVLFGMIATVHTVATMKYGVRQRLAAVGSARAAALAQSIDLYSSMPRASIAGTVGCATVNTYPKFPHQRCVTTSVVTGSVTRVRIIIRPTNTAIKEDTVFVDRVTSNTTPPFS
jgi:prepilin-type N-terminal cleavage/methylation domain-containing protein